MRSIVPVAFEHPVYVTRPMLPPLENYISVLRGVWERHWLTNKGKLHDTLEKALCDYLRVTHLSLTSNGTTALMLAFRALDLTGEVVTTPFTFPATPHALTWCGITPVFADIDPVTLTLDPSAVERAITPKTTAIVGVHIYGMPCAFDALQAIADRHGLRVVYDGAHAFGVEINGEPILKFGDATILSFHATKLFNTAEGGAVVVADPALKERVDLLKNLGIRNETTVELAGINGRLNELQAALGLANLQVLADEIRARAEIAEVYGMRLNGLDGITCFKFPPSVKNCHHYFLVRVDNEQSRISRDGLYDQLKKFNVFTRRYFYPICSELPPYRQMPSSRRDNLKVANRAGNEVLCLPFYGDLGTSNAHRICDMIEYLIQD